MFHLEPCNDRDFAFDERSRRTVQLSFASLNSASRSFISCEIPGHRTALRETFVYCCTRAGMHNTCTVHTANSQYKFIISKNNIASDSTVPFIQFRKVSTGGAAQMQIAEL